MLPTVAFPSISLQDYREAAGDEAVDRVREAAKPLHGARILHMNSTAFGGGVAELLLTQLGLLRDLGLDVTWQLVEGTEPFFDVTKAMHNGLQGMEVDWTPKMESTYLERLKANAPEVGDDYDVYFIHDPQPCALISLLEDAGRRSGAWIWRCHIDTSAPKRAIWDFFVPYINRYDAAIFTDETYAHSDVSGPKVAFIAPTIDPLSMKNVQLDPRTTAAVLRHYEVDPTRPILTQVSRFDPWKDPLGVIDAYRIVKADHPGTQLVMVGSLADDDPEGMEYLEKTHAHANGDPDIHLLTNLDHVGSLEVNAFQRASTVIIQKSTREGFGLVVAEGMWKEKPVVGGDVGGIRLQIEDGQSGFLVDSIESCAERIGDLLNDPALRDRLGKTGRAKVHQRFLTLRELEDYLRLMASLI